MSKEYLGIEPIKDQKEIDMIFELYENSGVIHYQDMLKLKAYLTPPTQEEVCKALSEYLGYNVIYGTHYTFVGEDEILCWFEHGMVVFNIYDLPPNLITLIGRFYEGLEKVGTKDV